MQVLACNSLMGSGSGPFVSTVLAALLGTLEGSGGSTLMTAHLSSFLAAAANQSGVDPSAVSLSVQVGSPVAAAPAPTAATPGSMASSTPLGLIIGVGLGGATALALLCLYIALLARRRRLKHGPTSPPGKTNRVAEISGLNPMHAAKARGEPARLRVKPSAQQVIQQQQGSAATGAITASSLANPIFASSGRRIVSPTALSSPSSDSHPKSNKSFPSVVRRHQEHQQQPLQRGATVAVRSTRIAPLLPPPLAELDPGEYTLGALNTFKSNPLHTKRVKASGTAPGRVGRAVKRDADADRLAAAVATTEKAAAAGEVASTESPLHSARQKRAAR
jgi:hypothetical protein